jgi:hypothetical protein
MASASMVMMGLTFLEIRTEFDTCAIEGKGPELADPVSPHVHHKCSKISHVHSVDGGYIMLYPEQAILVRSMKERHGKGK